MDKLKECAVAFEKLLDKKYKIILGRKGKEVELELTFNKEDFYHLIGLGKLRDLTSLKKKRELIFDMIIGDKIDYEMISKSNFFEANIEKNKFGIKDRIEYFTQIESIV